MRLATLSLTMFKSNGFGVCLCKREKEGERESEREREKERTSFAWEYLRSESRRLTWFRAQGPGFRVQGSGFRI